MVFAYMEKGSRSSYLFKNVGLLTISEFLSKLIVFLLVPLYTSVLTTEEYGVYGVYITTINLLVPILTIDIAHAGMRYLVDGISNKKSVVTISLYYCFVSIVLVCVFVFFNSTLKIILILDQYSSFFILMFVASAVDTLICNLTRGFEKIFDLAVSSFICTAITLACNILFLTKYNMGLGGYFIANTVGLLYRTIHLLIATHIHRFISFPLNRKLKNEMSRYSLPLMLNSVSWWANDASDRYIVTWICGVAENGIYSVGYKIPSILSMFSSVFSQAWTLSASKESDKEDREKYYSDMYKRYNACIVIACSLILAFDKLLARFLYTNEFYEAWKYVPFLLVAFLFGALSSYLGALFSALKKTKVAGISTVVGAVTNVILNLILIYAIGTIGAALATLISNVVIWIIRLLYVNKYIHLDIKLGQNVLIYMLLLMQSLIMCLVSNSILLYVLQFGLFIIFLVAFRNDIVQLVEGLFELLSLNKKCKK